MSAIVDIILTLFMVLGILFIIMALLSPFESLGWWAGWSKQTVDRELTGERDNIKHTLNMSAEPGFKGTKREAQHYLVYLRGIATAVAAPSRREQGFLDYLSDILPGSKIISDVFPYSATNNPLTGERTFARWYELLHKARNRYRNSLFAAIFVMRNLLQVGVSGDQRYGPIYNAGIAREISYSLMQQGYSYRRPAPIWVMGWSGAGQIALGAARYLRQLFQARVYVISIGGVLLDDPGIADITHLYHLEGSKDNFPRLGDLLSPGRWPFIRYSPWSKASKEGRITVINPGPMKHTGRDDYFDHKALLPNGQTHAQRTAEVIARLITNSDTINKKTQLNNENP